MPAVTLLLFVPNLDVHGFHWQLGKKVCLTVFKMLFMADLPQHFLALTRNFWLSRSLQVRLLCVVNEAVWDGLGGIGVPFCN